MKYSNEINEVIKLSKDVAVEIGDDYISSYHFLLASLRYNNLPKKIFEKLDWKFEHLRIQLNKEHKIKIENHYLTLEFEKSLKYSNYYAWTYFQNEISTEHLILAMIADERSFAGKYLNGVGMNYNRFKSELLQITSFRTREAFEKLGRNEFALRIGLTRLMNIFI